MNKQKAVCRGEMLFSPATSPRGRASHESSSEQPICTRRALAANGATGMHEGYDPPRAANNKLVLGAGWAISA